jgi:hypothetical protein
MRNFVSMEWAIAGAALCISAWAGRAWGAEPRYNEVFQVASHNSYWVHRDPVWDPFATGTQERLLDLLLFDHARALEIDVHKDPRNAGEWNVYHTDRPLNSFCTPFTECLKQLRQFQYALPDHEPLTVVIELKEILDYNFDAAHTPADFDRLLERELGPYLYRPRDFLARCEPGATLRGCAREAGWPAERELRGKILFAVLGNWRFCTIGHGTSGWATYATWNGDGQGGAAARSGFPMSSDFVDFSSESCGTEYLSPEVGAAALEASVFQQVENVDDPVHLEQVRDFISEGGIVRGHDAWTVVDQEARVAQGFQFFQTDYPWVQVDELGPAEPVRLLSTGAGLHEPGERLWFQLDDGAGYVFARLEAGSTSEWETLPATTRPSPNAALPNPRPPRGKGCLRAENLDESFAICRQTVGGSWLVPKPRGENAAITVEVRKRGNESVQTFYTRNHVAGRAGDHLRLSLAPGSAGETCATAYSASDVLPSGVPRWNRLVTECFGGELPFQGLSAEAGDVLFVRTRHDGAPVAAAGLSPSGEGFHLVDLTQ